MRFSIVWLVAAMMAPVAQARPLRPSDIGQICAAEIERFCPTLSGTTEVRNQRICLRPYHTSLTRPCRRALAATH